MEPPGKRSAATYLLLVLAVLLPFEAPLFRVGPLVITSVELLLYLTLAAWLALHRPRRLPRGLMVVAVALLVAVTFLSALAATPSLRGPALKVALRFASGGLLFLAARDLARPRAVALAVSVGAALSALGAVLEVALPASASLWAPFRAQGFSALGVARASGPFAYPTIAGMYWEASLPLAAVLLFTGARRLWPGALAFVALAGLLVTAIVFSATRAALAGTVVAGAGLLMLARRIHGPTEYDRRGASSRRSEEGASSLAVTDERRTDAQRIGGQTTEAHGLSGLGWRSGARLRLAAGAMLAITLCAYALALAGGSRSLLAQRLRWWRAGSWFSAAYTLEQPALTRPAGRRTRVPVTVTNTGSIPWPRAGSDGVHLSYHLEIDDGGAWRLLDFDGMRTLLPADVPPRATVTLAAVVAVPAHPGRYRLRWDMVRETVTWFSERGSPTADQLLEVTGAVATAAPQADIGTTEELMARRTPSRPELWRAALALWQKNPWLGVGPDNFRHRYPEVLAQPPGEILFEDERLHANSLYLETLADLGLAGAVALALLGVALARQARGDPTRLLCAVAAATFFVHGVVNTFLTFTPTYGLFWLLLGAVQKAASQSESSLAT